MGYGVSNELTKYEKIKRTVRMRQNMDVFTVCPEYETEDFKIRKLEAGDAEGLISIIRIRRSSGNVWNTG